MRECTTTWTSQAPGHHVHRCTQPHGMHPGMPHRCACGNEVTWIGTPTDMVGPEDGDTILDFLRRHHPIVVTLDDITHRLNVPSHVALYALRELVAARAVQETPDAGFTYVRTIPEMLIDAIRGLGAHPFASRSETTGNTGPR